MRMGIPGAKGEDTAGGKHSSVGAEPVSGLSRGRERLLRRISVRKGREAEGVVVLEGPRVIATAMECGARISFVLSSEDVPASEGVKAPHVEARLAADEVSGQVPALLRRLAESDVEVLRLPAERVASFSGTDSPRGLLAVAEQPDSPLPDPVRGAVERWLVLDGVQDPGNVGALIRTASALGIDRVLVLDGTADPWGAKAVRSSAGTVFSLPVHSLGWPELEERLPHGAPPLLVADAGGQDVRAWLNSRGDVGASAAPWALVLGNEGRGPRPEALARAVRTVAVPIGPAADSLNVSSAGAILLWALGPGQGT